MYLFIVNKKKEKEKEIQKKRNIKSRKINKRKRKKVSSHTYHNMQENDQCSSDLI